MAKTNTNDPTQENINGKSNHPISDNNNDGLNRTHETMEDEQEHDEDEQEEDVDETEDEMILDPDNEENEDLGNGKPRTEE